jgi:hypothetical protein
MKNSSFASKTVMRKPLTITKHEVVQRSNMSLLRAACSMTRSHPPAGIIDIIIELKEGGTAQFDIALVDAFDSSGLDRMLILSLWQWQK